MRFRPVLAVLVGAIFMSDVASAQLFKGLPDFGFPKPAPKEDNTAGKVVGAGAGCVIGGGAGYLATKALDGFLKKQGYSNKQVEQAAIAVAGVGCVVGGAAAVAIIENMDKQSKQKQEDAWATAQAQTGPVTWKGPDGSGYSGSTELIEQEVMPDGKSCGTRKDYVVKASSGEAEAYSRVCKDGAGVYRPVEA